MGADDVVDHRVDVLERTMIDVRGTLARIGGDVRKISGWATVHDEASRTIETEFAVMKHRMCQVENALGRIDTAQQTIIEKLGGIETKWSAQLVSILASAAVVVAGTIWTVLVK